MFIPRCFGGAPPSSGWLYTLYITTATHIVVISVAEFQKCSILQSVVKILYACYVVVGFAIVHKHILLFLIYCESWQDPQWIKAKNNAMINPFKTKRICFIQGPSAYRAVNTLHFGYKNQSLNVL
jgi:hypothetical protein